MNEPQETRPPVATTNSAPRPALSLRLGITGLRRLRADQIERIKKQMGEVLDLVSKEMTTLSQNPGVCPFYAHEPHATPIPFLRMVSPIARGADRVAARAALDRGYELFVPTPFAYDEYVKDFTGSDPDHPEEVSQTADGDRKEFDDLLKEAKGTIQLDGGRKLFLTDADNSLEGFSYEFVGHFVVRHCDVLIAIWDGKGSRGRGGTADIVRYAASVGVPVWWIHTTTPTDPAWLADRHDWRDVGPTTGSPTLGGVARPSAAARLQTHLERLILMPALAPRHRRKARPEGQKLAKLPQALADIYFNEPPSPATGIWKTYSKMMSIFKHPPRAPMVEPVPSPVEVDPLPRPEAVQQHWLERYSPADDRAGEFAARYRSSYVLVIAFATIALALGSLAIGILVAYKTGFHYIPESVATAMTFLELAFLIAALVLAFCAQHFQWHVRSIEYRLLAELFRKQETLAALGWSLSIGNVRHLTDADRQSWVSWLFAASQRAAPLPSGDMTSLAQRKANRTILTELIDEQVKYHEGREDVSHRAAEAFEAIGFWVFGAVIAVVLVKLGMEVWSPTHFHWIILFGLSAAVLPGVSAAFVGVRSYAELQLLADQSQHMIAELKDARVRVAQLHLERALSSQDLGTEALAVTAIMLQDLDGWGRLFRGKVAGVA